MFEKLAMDDISTFNWIAFFVAVGMFLLPENYLFDLIFSRSHSTVNSKSYDDVKLGFIWVCFR